MTDWLLEHQASLQYGVLLTALGALLAWETLLPRRGFAIPLGGRWFNQIALTTLGSLAVRWSAPVAAAGLALLAQEKGWGLLNVIAVPPWLAVIVGVIAIDFGMYAQHRLYHAAPLFWRFHQIHHCDLDVDCGTALRNHPVDNMIAQAFDLAVIVAVGVPPLAVLVGATLAALASLFNHANIAVPKAVDRVLRAFLVTPDMHRIHHSADSGESNRNFANLFSWWDRLFSTYQDAPRLGPTTMPFGLADTRADKDFSLWTLLALPFRRRATDALDVRVGQPEASP